MKLLYWNHDHVSSLTSIGLLVFFTSILCSHHVSSGRGTWSMWFDVEPLFGVDNQTVQKITELFDYDCPPSNMIDAQCRVKDTSNVFTSTNWHEGTFLRVPCNGSGILCTLEDQIFMNLVGSCSNYEVRFLCLTDDSTNAEGNIENPLSVNGGFIAMAAGLSVVVPLICVLIIQLRKAKRDERERRLAEANGAENGGETLPSSDPPPAYDQLFGPNYQSTSPIHSRNSSLDALIEEDEIAGTNTDVSDSEPRAHDSSRHGRSRSATEPGNAENSNNNETNDNANNQQVPAEGARTNPAFSSTSSVSTISGSHVSDNPLTSSTQERDATPSDSTDSSDSTSAPASSSTPGSPGDHEHSSNQPSTSSSSQSTSEALPPPPPPPPPPPIPRSPPPPFSSWSSRRNNRNGPAPQSAIQQTLRRLPGMHISIEEFFASLRGIQDNENDGPPPSYEDALKILENAKKNEEATRVIK